MKVQSLQQWSCVSTFLRDTPGFFLSATQSRPKPTVLSTPPDSTPRDEQLSTFLHEFKFINLLIKSL